MMLEKLPDVPQEKIAQMILALDGEEPAIDRTELPCRYTAERFQAYYPERYQKAVKLLASGFSVHEVAKFVHADYRTIRQVELHNVADVDAAREIVRKQSLGIMIAMGERALELVDKCQKPADAMIAGGIAKDIYLQTGGLPTARIEVDHKIDCSAELAELLRKAEETVKTVQATVIEVPSAQLENE